MQESITLTQTLTNLAELDRYNYWLYEQIADAVGTRVLEVGSGTGNITQFLATPERHVTATDVVPSYRRLLQETFAHQPQVEVGEFNLDKAASDEYARNYQQGQACWRDPIAMKDVDEWIINNEENCNAWLFQLIKKNLNDLELTLA